MAGMYINRTYFADVHPPLGKLMIALIGVLFEYDGKYSFEDPGNSYISDDGISSLVPYIPMRIGCALFGAMVIPIVYLIILITIKSNTAALLASTLLICDVGMVTISRYILLDPIMLFFMFGSILCIVKLTSYQNVWCVNEDKSFGFAWWLWLLLAGCCLGCVLAVKIVGFFTILFLGLWTTVDLWNMLGNLQVVGGWSFFKHLIARVFGLILIPLLTYFGIFYVHFCLLSKTGPGKIFHSTTFQATLIDDSLYNRSIFVYVEHQSSITIRNGNAERMFLHSHKFFYPDSIKQETYQQVTGYMMRDGNNLWKIQQISSNLLDQKPVQSGDVVRLVHLLSNKCLSLAVDRSYYWQTAPLTKWHLMVSATDSSLVVDNSDQWTVQLYQSPSHNDSICTINCFLQFFNKPGNCYLCSSNKVLPEWGKKQHEITCSSSPRDLENCVWFVEEATASTMNAPTHTIPSMSTFEKFLETHRVMFNLNSKLLKKPGESVSKPWQWPLNYKPKLFSKPEDKRFLVGTPLVWWINLLAIPVYCFTAILYAILDGRREIMLTETSKTFRAITANLSSIKHKTLNNERCVNGYKGAHDILAWYFLGWTFHYLPFFAMSRVLFFHHYLPAHVFACMLSGAMIDRLSFNLTSVAASYININPRTIHYSVVAIVCAVITHNFFTAFHLCYGTSRHS